MGSNEYQPQKGLEVYLSQRISALSQDEEGRRLTSEELLYTVGIFVKHGFPVPTEVTCLHSTDEGEDIGIVDLQFGDFELSYGFVHQPNQPTIVRRYIFTPTERLKLDEERDVLLKDLEEKLHRTEEVGIDELRMLCELVECIAESPLSELSAQGIPPDSQE